MKDIVDRRKTFYCRSCQYI